MFCRSKNILHKIEGSFLIRNVIFNQFNTNPNICLSSILNNEKATNLEQHRAKIMSKNLPKVKHIKDVNKIILVASGKGGVGKSTTAVNLAVAMKQIYPDKNIGLLDADIFGPSLPLMMNLHDTPLIDSNKLMLPLTNYGVKCMSMGFLIEEGLPVIWRGLMVMQALEKLMRGVSWGPVDYLVVDTPPGTGDTHLSLIQNLPISGVLLVTTPQNAALQVTKRGAVMFKKLKVPIIGLLENMSSIDCPKCSNNIRLFGSKTDELSHDINVPVLCRMPLENEVTDCCDDGTPIVVKNPKHRQSLLYNDLASKVVEFIK